MYHIKTSEQETKMIILEKSTKNQLCEAEMGKFTKANKVFHYTGSNPGPQVRPGVSRYFGCASSYDWKLVS